MQQTGIVLKHYAPYCNKVAIFDKEKGHIVGIVNHAHLSSSAIITYQLQKASSTYFFIKNIKLFHMPLPQTDAELFFIHHIIEIIYHFTPQLMPVSTIYDLLWYLYQQRISEIPMTNKLLFLGKIFIILGFTPTEMDAKFSAINQLLYSPIDVLLHTRVSTNMQDTLHNWLMHCIFLHPQASMFRTISFIKN